MYGSKSNSRKNYYLRINCYNEIKNILKNANYTYIFILMKDVLVLS